MPDISIHEARERIGTAQLVDVREAHEVAEARIAETVHIPLGELGGRLAELDRSRPIVAVCRSGARSARATALLKAAGFDCHNMSGGMMAWQAAGLPTV